MHVASTLGQLDGIPLEGVKAYISDAKSIKQLIDMPYPADEIAKVLTAGLMLSRGSCQQSLLPPAGLSNAGAVMVQGLA